MANEKNILTQALQIIADQLVGTFGRETSIVDNSAAKKALADPEERKKVFQQIHELSSNNSILELKLQEQSVKVHELK